MTSQKNKKSLLLILALAFLFVEVNADFVKGQNNVLLYNKTSRILSLNERIQAEGKNWIASETSISKRNSEKSPLILSRKVGLKKLGIMAPFEIEKTEDTNVLLRGDSILPSNLDWRNNSGNWLTPVQNQGRCGSCWAFSAVGVLESRFKINLDNSSFNIDLSEQDLIYCNSYGFDCNGGHEGYALVDVYYNGIVSESCFPYQESEGDCSNKCDELPKKIQDVFWINVSEGGVNAIKEALTIFGPITVYMGVYDDFIHYNGGVYETTQAGNESAYFNIFGEPNLHAVVLIGYNDAERYWICKNSWGSQWGENGYFRISYNANSLFYHKVANESYFFLDDSYFVNNTDYDGDGISDTIDKCAYDFGLDFYNGCPDTIPPKCEFVNYSNPFSLYLNCTDEYDFKNVSVLSKFPFNLTSQTRDNLTRFRAPVNISGTLQFDTIAYDTSNNTNQTTFVTEMNDTIKSVFEKYSNDTYLDSLWIFNNSDFAAINLSLTLNNQTLSTFFMVENKTHKQIDVERFNLTEKSYDFNYSIQDFLNYTSNNFTFIYDKTPPKLRCVLQNAQFIGKSDIFETNENLTFVYYEKGLFLKNYGAVANCSFFDENNFTSTYFNGTNFVNGPNQTINLTLNNLIANAEDKSKNKFNLTITPTFALQMISYPYLNISTTTFEPLLFVNEILKNIEFNLPIINYTLSHEENNNHTNVNVTFFDIFSRNQTLFFSFNKTNETNLIVLNQTYNVSIATTFGNVTKVLFNDTTPDIITSEIIMHIFNVTVFGEGSAWVNVSLPLGFNVTNVSKEGIYPLEYIAYPEFVLFRIPAGDPEVQITSADVTSPKKPVLSGSKTINSIELKWENPDDSTWNKTIIWQGSNQRNVSATTTSTVFSKLKSATLYTFEVYFVDNANNVGEVETISIKTLEPEPVKVSHSSCGGGISFSPIKKVVENTTDEINKTKINLEEVINITKTNEIQEQVNQTIKKVNQTMNKTTIKQEPIKLEVNIFLTVWKFLKNIFQQLFG